MTTNPDPRSETDRTPHSAEQFGEQRDSWYHRDFLALLARRLGPATEARTLLEVGFGHGHWSATVAPLLPRLEHVTGVDFEARWVAEGEANLQKKLGALPFTLELVQADAHALPFEDDRFDLVTCQTVLMHLGRPEVALAEMVRVTRPGGWVLAAEPANLYPFIALDSAVEALGLDAQSARCRLWLAIRRGRIAAGEGDWNLGDRLPALFARAGAEDFRIVMNDKVRPVEPPYDDPEARALVRFELEWLDAALTQERAHYRDLGMRGGLAPDEVDRLLANEDACQAERHRQVEAGTFAAPGGSLHFLAWGRKPLR